MPTSSKSSIDAPTTHVRLSPRIQEAIASLHLEGITLTDASLRDLELFSNGELSKEDVIKRVLARVKPDAN